MPNHDFRLITGIRQLDQTDNETKLVDLGITHLSTVIVIARFNGGTSDLYCLSNKCMIVPNTLVPRVGFPQFVSFISPL